VAGRDITTLGRVWCKLRFRDATIGDKPFFTLSCATIISVQLSLGDVISLEGHKGKYNTTKPLLAFTVSLAMDASIRTAPQGASPREAR